MKKQYEILICDICKQEVDNIEAIKYPVLFTIEQTEGKPCEPYISYNNVDFCKNCINKVIMVTGRGAQGSNTYALKLAQDTENYQRKVIDSYKEDLKKIVNQLESCYYECEGGFLINNVAFIALKEIAYRIDGK